MNQKNVIKLKEKNGRTKLYKHGDSITIVSMLESALVVCLLEYKRDNIPMELAVDAACARIRKNAEEMMREKEGRK